MKYHSKILAFLFVLCTLLSCGTQKNNFLNRSFNSMAAKYNILYNGQLAFQEGLDELKSKYVDNFREQLVLEPISFDENKISLSDFGQPTGVRKTTSTKNLSFFEKAEEKASKAIQLHSMLIDGRERNNQIDDAYLLLGKSRYYTQRFVPAIDAFNYIIKNYPFANLIDETRIWRAKANIRINNELLAIESLQLVLRKNNISKKIKEEVHTTLAMAYLQGQNTKEAINQLILATKTQVNTAQTARNLFVLGQLYQQEKNSGAALATFKRIINLKEVPYTFYIHSKIEMASLLSGSNSIPTIIAQLKKLTLSAKNAPFLSELYYQMGLLESESSDTKKATFYFKKSITAANTTPYEKTFSYEKLGDLSFKQADYVSAGAYYDSVIQVAKKRTDRRIRAIQRKYNNLANLINFEKVLKNSDSILSIVSLSKQQQRAYFEKYIEKIKEIAKKRATEKANQVFFGSTVSNLSFQQNTKSGKWYFYNIQSLRFGKEAFDKVWGSRPLEDNWRFSDKPASSIVTEVNTKPTQDLSAYDVNTYLKALPKSRATIDSLIANRNNALYQTGIIYKEQFKNLTLASKRFERLLNLNPNKDFILPTRYHLYQVYLAMDDPRSATLKQEIIRDNPQSVYAKILQGDTTDVSVSSISQTEAIYRELYYMYKEGKYFDVSSQITELAPSIQESKLIAKFELLKALSIGKFQNKANFKKALEFVVTNYPNTIEGKRAKEIVKQLK